MEFADVIKTRVSIRSYSDKEVEEEKLTYILDCARRAPSWENKQCWRFIVIKNKDTITELAKIGLVNRWLKTAPIIIVACADPTESGTHSNLDYYPVDVAIAMEHLILAATDAGLGTCWIGVFNEQKIKELLEIPKRIRVIALTPIGYPEGAKGIVPAAIKRLIKPGKRKTLDEIVHYDQW